MVGLSPVMIYQEKYQRIYQIFHLESQMFFHLKSVRFSWQSMEVATSWSWVRVPWDPGHPYENVWMMHYCKSFWINASAKWHISYIMLITHTVHYLYCTTTGYIKTTFSSDFSVMVTYLVKHQETLKGATLIGQKIKEQIKHNH